MTQPIHDPFEMARDRVGCNLVLAEHGAMNTLEHLCRLFAYDDWANREVLGAIRVSGSPIRPLKLIGHILSAERLWFERIERHEQTFPVWPEFTLPQCEEQAAELLVRWKNFLSTARETLLTRPVSYQNSKGESWTSRVEDILLHVIMHSAYHRGQIAMDMRAAGFAPAYTDFIHAVRQGLVE